MPVRQVPQFGTTWVLQTRLSVEEATKLIKSVAYAHDTDLPVSNFRTLAEVRSTALAPRRVVVSLIGMFGLLALVITAAGIAGVIAFSTARYLRSRSSRPADDWPRGAAAGLGVGNS